MKAVKQARATSIGADCHRKLSDASRYTTFRSAVNSRFLRESADEKLQLRSD